MNTIVASTKLALLAREMRSASGGFNALQSEPIAIVGVACRFPGGALSPDLFWSLMENGVDAIREVPADRWNINDYYHPDPAVSGKMITRHGGFLERIDCFDAEFFGISPREANRMDPQQRIFLEVAWEALHDAGQLPKNLSGSLTGVYLAIYYNDYARMQLGEPAGIDAYTLSGTAHSLSVGRLSYLLNLRGPSMVVDTACSSSLVAVHLACQSLRAGESNMALAGGVSTIIRPEENIPLSKWGLVAADGRCKTFDSRADGFIRGEGCGVIVLKRLSDALGDGDRIHAIIRGTAVNQDGRSTFLTAPNGLSQQAVIREALRNARVDPAQISYVEAHGTGTKLGDPIEVEALAEVIGKARPEGFSCPIGSVKTNIGHLEAASGIAGLIKVVLSLQHERIPPHLHFRNLNPLINLKDSSLVILPEGAPWLAGPQPRFAGVSSFGFGGTNAHVVLEDAPRLPLPVGQTDGTPGRAYLLPISAGTNEGLYILAESYREFLGLDGSGRVMRLDDICFTAGVKREHLDYRTSFIGRSHEEMIVQIDGFLASRLDARLPRTTVDRLKTGIVSPGAGSSEVDGIQNLMRKESAFKSGGGSFLEPHDQGAWTAAASLETIGARYLAGDEIKWEALFPPGCRIVSLPGYPWQRQRYWIEEPSKPQVSAALRLPDPASHPLLGRSMESPFLTGFAFESFIGPERPPFIGQHRVFGRPVMPATAFIEMALSATDEARLKSNTPLAKAGSDDLPIVVENLAIHEPLLLPEEGLCRVQTGMLSEGGITAFQIFSRTITGASADTWRLHVSGRLKVEKDQSFRPKRAELQIALRKAQEACPDDLDPDAFYQGLTLAGIEFGQVFRGIEAIRRGRSEALGRIRATDQVSMDMGDYRFHPAWFDACLQVFGALTPYSEDEGRSPGLFIPIGIERVLLFGRPAGPLWSHVHLRAEPKDPALVLVGDVLIFDDNAQPVALLDGVSLMAVQPEKLLRYTTADTRGWLYQTRWRPQPIDRGTPDSDSSETQSTNWLILADHSGIAAGLKRRLLADGCECVELYCGNQFKCFSRDKYEVDPGSPEDFKRVVTKLLRELPPSRWGIVHLWGLDHPRSESTMPDFPLEAQKQSCGGMLHLIQAMPIENGQPYQRLWAVTRGAMDVGGAESIDPRQAPLWGLGSVLSLERPDLGCVRIDLDPDGRSEFDVEAIYMEMQSRSIGENRVAFRDGRRYVARLVELESEVQPVRGPSSSSTSMELRAADSGLIEELSFHPVPRRPPGRGEIEIKVEAVGLNFRDVLNALKMLPGMETPLGGECAGRVVAVGEAVQAFHPGDEVLAFAIGSFRSFVTIPAQFAFRKPATLSFEEAASIPVVFLTAHYGMRHLAKLAAGEKVLIHAASGGVGLAAIQIAQRAGAEIFATAGNPEKRQWLSSLGVPHVMDSRSTGFADAILAKTGGEGIDVVLNSLAGEMIPKSLSLLRKGGRFLEIGKRGIWDEAQVAQFKSGISYWPFDLGQVAQADPGLFEAMLSAVMSEFSVGGLKPIRHTVFNQRETADAFQTMARAKHIGKIVISLAGADSEPEKPSVPNVRSDGTYLITGGLGALGLEVSRWLCDCGARHIVLVGRHGPTEKAEGVLENMRQQGARVSVKSADLAQRPQLDQVLDEIRREMPPLCGVVHAAGVIDDGMLQNQDWERFVKVMAPKIDGAWNLHRATEEMPLDFFVLFSSAASILGWQGQGAYAAGNAFLDALAHYRRRRGLVALSINWGPWAETGMAAGLESLQKRRMEAKGLLRIGSADALLAFQRMLMAAVPQVVALRVDWPKFFGEQADGAGRRFFSEIGAWRSTRPQPKSPPEKDSDFLGKLSRVPASERRDLLADHIEIQAAGVLGIARGKRIDRQQALHEIGLDSLMAVEMRNSMCRLLSCTLPPTLLFDYPTIEALVDYLADQVLKLEASSETSSEIPQLAGSPDADIAYLQSISDADAEALLREELKRLPKED